VHLSFRDHALLLHQPEDRIAALPGALGPFRLARQEVGRRGVQKARKRGGLGEGQVFGALTEVTFRSQLRPVGAVPEVHGVEVGREDLRLGVPPFVGESERGLDEAPPEGDLEPLLLRDVEVFHQLLGYCGPAFLYLPGPQVGPGGPHDPLEVYPEVVVEAPVLDGDDRPREVLAKVIGADRLAALFNLELADPVRVRVVDVGVLGELGVSLVEAIPVLPDHDEVKTDHKHEDRGG
jgi:hypothetical protein